MAGEDTAASGSCGGEGRGRRGGQAVIVACWAIIVTFDAEPKDPSFSDIMSNYMHSSHAVSTHPGTARCIGMDVAQMASQDAR